MTSGKKSIVALATAIVLSLGMAGCAGGGGGSAGGGDTPEASVVPSSSAPVEADAGGDCDDLRQPFQKARGALTDAIGNVASDPAGSYTSTRTAVAAYLEAAQVVTEPDVKSAADEAGLVFTKAVNTMMPLETATSTADMDATQVDAMTNTIGLSADLPTLGASLQDACGWS